MTADEWNDAHTRAIGMYLSGYLKSRTHTGEPERDWPFLLLFNGGTHTIDFVLPRMPYGHSYTVLVDTTNGAPIGAGAVYRAGETIRLEPFVAIVTRAERDLEVE
jgi:hypothetical protein